MIFIFLKDCFKKKKNQNEEYTTESVQTAGCTDKTVKLKIFTDWPFTEKVC